MDIREFSHGMGTIGQQLQHARLALNLSVEDVAFRTRIPAGLVRCMENDDLSHFANLTYARGFLKLYSQFLGMDISEHLAQFSTQEFSHASGHEYVQTANATLNLPPAVFSDRGRSRRPGLYILLLAALAAGGVIWWNHRGGETSGSGGTESEAPSAAVPGEAEPFKNTAPPAVIPPAEPAPAPVPAAEVNTPPPPAEDPVIPPAAPGATDKPPPAPDAPPETPAKPPKAVVVDEVDPSPPPPKPED